MLIYIVTHDGKLNSTGWKNLTDARNFVLGRVTRRQIVEDEPMKVSYLDKRGNNHDWLIYAVEVEDGK